MQPDPPQGDPRSDAELISSARSGDPSAFGVLYARHAPAVTSMARYYARDNFTADDLVSEAFERTMTVLRGGGGPDVSFRAYIYTVVRRLAYEQTEKAAKTRVTNDFSAFEMPDEIVDPAVSSFEGRVVTGAFATLPERWQAVLWYIEVEGMSPPEVAPILGLTANGVSALAYRAREGLRQAYLQLHVTSTAAKPDCEPFRGKLGAYARNDVSTRDTAKIENHLSTCDDCTAIVAELQDVGHGMRVIIAPLVLGGVAAAGLGFMSPPASASAAVLLAPRGAGKLGKGAGAVAGIAAVAVLATVVAVTLSGAQQPQAEALDDQTTQVTDVSPTVKPKPKPVDTTTPAPPPTVPPATPPRTPPRTVDPVKPSIPAPTPTKTPEVIPRISVAMDEVGNLVLGRDGMVGTTVSNTGTVAASAATLTITLPAGVTLDESRALTTQGADWSCSAIPTGVSCAAPEIAVGQSSSVYVPVFVDVTADTATVPSASASAARAATVTAQGSSPVVGFGLGTRFLADGNYAITQSGASFLTCDALIAGCLDAQLRVGELNNDMYPMVPVDEAGLGTVSSISTLDIPAGATVTNAGLYWSGIRASGNIALEGSIQLSGPGGTTASVIAERVDHVDMPAGLAYQSYADVTALVQGAGAGDWIASGAEVNPMVGSYAGWALVVVYSDPSLSEGRVAVFDGMQKVGDTSVTFEVAGLANTSAEVGMVAWEGDAGISGDGVVLDGTVLSRSHDGADPNNSMDSRANGSSIANTFGVDVGSFLSTMLTAQKVPLTAFTNGDHYAVGVVTVTSR